MNWEAIGAIGETVGAVAVIATLFYLAVQIRQNNRNVEENIRRLRLDAGVSTIEAFSRYRAYLCQPGAAEWWRRNQIKFPHALVAEANRSNG